MRRIHVDFAKKIRDWDGFGINYVEAAQTRDYQADPQEYGGFSLLPEASRQTILDMIFGENGLKPGVVKMFLDPFHQEEPGPDYDFDPDAIDLDAYDHTTTTAWMLHFVREGLARTRVRGDELQIVVTLYGPPAWMTKQRVVRGRDLDPDLKFECARYMISWAKYLRKVEDFPVRYISLHNEGEDWQRWPPDDSSGTSNHDYNMYWPPEQVVDFIKFMPAMLEAQRMGDVGVTPGETTTWTRFSDWGYADAIANDPEALANLSLITSHGFRVQRSLGNDVLRARRPDLHSWVTSTSWSKMDARFLREIRDNVYVSKANAIIPWACIQRPPKWVGGDPNPGCAFRVHEDGTYETLPGYYFYKQVCRAGQPGMAVAQVASNDDRITLLAFASNGTANPDAFAVLNLSDEQERLEIKVFGAESSTFQAYRTSTEEMYVSLGGFEVRDDVLTYEAAPGSATTFYAAGVESR